jgi:hypothetical protein
MKRFLIELPHTPEVVGCAQVVKSFLTTGSHYLTNADWGCADGVHSAWLVVESENHDEARLVVPPPFRSDAIVTSLVRYNLAEVEQILTDHEAQESA